MSPIGNHFIACYSGAFASHSIHMFNNSLFLKKWNVDTQNLKNKTSIQVNFLIALFGKNLTSHFTLWVFKPFSFVLVCE